MFKGYLATYIYITHSSHLTTCLCNIWYILHLWQLYITSLQHYQIEWIIRSIAKDTAGRVAYSYVNSLNPMLMKVARRALLNRKLFGTSVPTIQERVEYEQRKYATFCPTAISPFNGRFIYPQSYKAFWYNWPKLLFETTLSIPHHTYMYVHSSAVHVFIHS